MPLNLYFSFVLRMASSTQKALIIADNCFVVQKILVVRNILQ